jgi:hypothetical protein
MTSPYQPRLMQARNATERMQALGEFIELWLGPRKKTYGVPAGQLNKVSLPMPLKWLHEFAGRWPALKDGVYSEGKGKILGCQDWLRPVNKLTFSESGKLEFLDENQGCWVCRTLPDGDDPPVWCEGDIYDARQNFVEGETLICDSLSKFLVTFALQELTLGARFILDDETLKKKFRSAKKDKAPLWLKGETADFRTSSFWLWNGSLVADLSWGGWHFAANHPQAIDFLENKQGAVETLELWFRRTRGLACDLWHLSFKSDGSASAVYLERPPPATHIVYPEPVKATAAEGTFDLPELHHSLAGRLKGRGDQQKEVEVHVYHAGQLGAAAQFLSDVTLFEELFEQTISASGKGRSKLKRLFAERWSR